MKRTLNNKDLPFDSVFPKILGKCAYCGVPIVGRRKKWCGKTCGYQAFTEVMARRGNSKALRELALERDNGICAKCGVDSLKLYRILSAAEGVAYWDDARLHPNRPHFILLKDLVQKLGYGLVQTLWQADHIIEVRHGGSHEMDNIQTLCIKCHKLKTRFNYRKPGKWK